jgi:hypothetical protein
MYMVIEIKDYMKDNAQSQLLESDVKRKFNFESDMWNY